VDHDRRTLVDTRTKRQASWSRATHPDFSSVCERKDHASTPPKFPSRNPLRRQLLWSLRQVTLSAGGHSGSEWFAARSTRIERETRLSIWPEQAAG
jgi:hypothetical protein